MFTVLSRLSVSKWIIKGNVVLGFQKQYDGENWSLEDISTSKRVHRSKFGQRSLNFVECVSR